MPALNFWLYPLPGAVHSHSGVKEPSYIWFTRRSRFYLHAPRGGRIAALPLDGPRTPWGFAPHPTLAAGRLAGAGTNHPPPKPERIAFRSASRPSRLTAVATRALTLPSTRSAVNIARNIDNYHYVKSCCDAPTQHNQRFTRKLRALWRFNH